MTHGYFLPFLYVLKQFVCDMFLRCEGMFHTVEGQAQAWDTVGEALAITSANLMVFSQCFHFPLRDFCLFLEIHT